MNVFELTGTTLSVIFAAVYTAVSIAVAAEATVVLLIASPPTSDWGCTYKQALVKQVCSVKWVYAV